VSAADAQIAAAVLSLRDAQLVVAREYGFENWTHLKRHIESLHEGGTRDIALKDLLEAANNRRTERIAEILDAHPNLINERGGDGTRTALHFASFAGHTDAMSLLLQRGADPNIRCEGDNAYPLHFAAEHGDLRAIELLVANGSDIHGVGDVHGVDVIGWACVFKDPVHTHVIDYLLSHGGKHNIYSAVSCGDGAAIRQLAAEEPGCLNRPMSSTEDGRTPIQQALVKRQPEAALLLVDLGADLDAADTDGLTPLDLAAILGLTDVADLLIGRGTTVTFPAALALNRQSDIHRLMSDEPDCLKPGNRWGRLIVAAGKLGSVDFITRLLDAGADVNAPGLQDNEIEGITPLHAAAFRHNPDLDLIRFLVDRGADLHAKDTTFNAPPSGWAHHAGNMDAHNLLRELEGKTS